MSLPKRILHWLIVANLATGFLSALYMVFVVHAVDGTSGPLFHMADTVPHEFWVRRRLYALEAWVTFGFLSVYLALTSLRPTGTSDDEAADDSAADD